MCFTIDQIEQACGLLLLNEFNTFVYCCKRCQCEFDSGQNLESHFLSEHQDDKGVVYVNHDIKKNNDSLVDNIESLLIKSEPMNVNVEQYDLENFEQYDLENVEQYDLENVEQCNLKASVSDRSNIKQSVSMVKVKVEGILAKVIPNDQTQAEIFKLKVDHFEELFDWLSLKDLIVLGQTCKRMQHIVGYYIRTNYAATKFEYTSDGIHASENDTVAQMKFDGWSSFLKKLVFPYLEYIRYDPWKKKLETTAVVIPHMKADRFKSLTEILLTGVKFTDKGISRIKEILSQLETVKLNLSSFVDYEPEFYESFLRFCTSIKKLCIEADYNTPFIGTDNRWLLRKYSTLEHFELTTHICFNKEITELQTFFEQNPNIKTFATNAEVLLVNRNIFASTELKLNVLSVEFSEFKNRNLTSFAETFELSFHFLKKLHERSLFKQLHVYFSTIYDSTFNQEIVNDLMSFNRLTKLSVREMEVGTDLSPLINLKQFCIEKASDFLNIQELAESLLNLEFVQFIHAGFDDIIPFIRCSPKLNTIVVFRLEGNNENIPEFGELNKERSKLSNARKVTIYVEERVYLAVKWTKNETNWNLIQIKRGASYDAWNHNFDYMHYPEMIF